MRYRVLSYPSPLQSRAEGCTVDSGRVNLPALEPGETGYACIAAWENPEIREKFFSKGDVLELEAIGLDGKSVCTRTYPISFAKSYFEGQLASLKRTGKGCCVNEADSLITLCSDWVDISFRRNDATIYSVLRKKDNRIIPLKNGPLPVGMQMKLVSLSARMEQRGDAVLCARYRGGADSVVWRLRPDGLLKMDAVLLNRASGGGGFDDAFTDNAILNFGFTFSYPESECTGMRWLGRGDCPRPRLKKAHWSLVTNSPSCQHPELYCSPKSSMMYWLNWSSACRSLNRASALSSLFPTNTMTYSSPLNFSHRGIPTSRCTDLACPRGHLKAARISRCFSM